MSTTFDILRQANSERGLFQEVVPGAVQAGARKPGLDIREQTREETITLVRRVFLSGAAIPQAVIFASVEHGSGCSWVCARAAEILSTHVEGSVCLVDADLRSPSLHRYLEVEECSRIVNEKFLLAPVRQIGRPSGGSNLWLLSNSSARAGSQTSLGFERLRSRVPELRKDFTHILIDSPPINACADAALLGEVADGLVLIIEANNTRREAAIRAKETITAAGVRLLGAVLNKRTFPIPEKLYRKL